jgi:cysteinyl-tRNA synthetase
MVAQRDRARAEKRWKEADALRDALASMGVLIQDGVVSSTWTL